MIIIAGHLTVPADRREVYVSDCVGIVEAARSSEGCLDFSITADSVEPDRVQIYERWATEAQLLAFRGSGASDDQAAIILDADVKRYNISTVGEP